MSAWLAERFLNGVPEGIALALLAWISLRVFVRKSSSARFGIWLSALVVIVALPLVRGLWASNALHAAAAPLVDVSGSWAKDLLGIWAAVSALALIGVGLGIWNLRKLHRDSQPIDTASLAPELQQTVRSFRSVRKVELALSSWVSVPAVIGFFRPIILLPAWALQELSTEQLNSILIHELAHLRRWDDWTNLAQKLARALLFFHPAIWWIDHQLSLEREMACDEFVLSSTSNPRAYAECLVSLAEKSLLRRTVALAQALVGRMSQTSRRVSQILDPGRHAISRRWKPAFALMAAFSAAGTFWLMRAPELVAFNDTPAGTVIANAKPSILPTAVAFHAAAHLAPQTPVVIPAKFVERGAAPRKTRTVLAKHEVALKLREPAALKASMHEQHISEPRVIQASTRKAVARPPVETVYVVTESENNASGSWMLCVWRVTVVNSSATSQSPTIVHSSETQITLPPSKT